MDIGAHPPTRATAGDAARLARELYGLEARACALPSEYDDNFRLETADGDARVLKVMHPMREAGFVDLQCAALRTVADRDPGLPVPRVLPDRAGRPYSTTTLGDGAPRTVWTLSYLAGRPIAGLRPVTAGLLEELGGALARLDLALAGFSHPSARRELKWDLLRAGWIRGHLGLVEDARRRALVERVLARYDAEAAPALGRLRRSVVYADANEHNVLVGFGPDRYPRLAGLIDFGPAAQLGTRPAVQAGARPRRRPSIPPPLPPPATRPGIPASRRSSPTCRSSRSFRAPFPPWIASVNHRPIERGTQYYFPKWLPRPGKFKKEYCAPFFRVTIFARGPE